MRETERAGKTTNREEYSRTFVMILQLSISLVCDSYIYTDEQQCLNHTFEQFNTIISIQ